MALIKEKLVLGVWSETPGRIQKGWSGGGTAGIRGGRGGAQPE